MSDLWLIAYERIQEDFDAGEISIEEVAASLKRLGFDQHEIDEHIIALTEAS